MFYEVFFYSCCLNFIDFSFVPPSRLSLSLIACAFLSTSPDTERKVFFLISSDEFHFDLILRRAFLSLDTEINMLRDEQKKTTS